MSFTNSFRLFYMATSTGTGGAAPTPDELRRQQDFADSVLTMEDTYRSIAIVLKDILKQHDEIAKEDKKIAEEYTKDLVKNYRDVAKSSLELLDNSDRLAVGQLRSKDVLKQINKLEAAQVSFATRQAQLAKQGIVLTEKEKIQQAEATEQIRQQVAILNEQLALSKQIEKTAGLTAKVFEGIKEIPLLNKFIDLEKVTEDIYESAAKNQSAWKSFGTGVSSVTKQLSSKLKDPVVQFGLLVSFYTKIIKSAYAHNELLTNTRRQLVLNTEQSEKLYNSQFKYASAQHDSFVTTKMMQESTVKLNESLGTSVYLGNQNVETFGRLTKYYGMSEEQAGKLVELSIVQGKNAKDVLNSTIKTAVSVKSQIGGSMSYQEVLKKVSNTSGDILTKFRGNTDALAAAILQANKLGMTLEQVDAVGESLLNFESSIESELKAELLTGKAINLEKARAAALAGDEVTLMKEISNQVGNIHDFEKLNVIQRKAYAEAFGMNVKDMSDMLRKKEFEAKLGEASKASAKEQLKYATEHGIKVEESVRQQLEAKSLADEQRETFEKLNEILGKIMQGPMSKFLHIIEKVLEKVNGIMGAFGKFTGGALGNALGTAILAAPLLIGATRLLSGGIKSMLLPKPSGRPSDPIATYDVGSGGGGGMGGGIMDMITGGGGFGGKRKLIGRFGSAAKARTAMAGFKGGGYAAAIGMGTELIASQMDEGGAKDVVSGAGQTLSYAGTGAMIGSVIPGIGTAVGAIVGGGIGLIKSFFEAEDNRKARDEAARKQKEAQDKRTSELLEQFATRPVQLNVGGKTILDFNTAQNLYGTSENSFA